MSLTTPITGIPATRSMCMADFECVCGARWKGELLPRSVAEKFRDEFVEAHREHTEPDPFFDADLLMEES